MSVTLKDIARACGTSVSSVSRILRGEDQVSRETRERVLSTARRLKYRPNLLVRGMQTGRTGLVGVLSSLDGFGVAVLGGISERLDEDAFLPVLQSTHKHPDGYVGRTEFERISQLIGMRIDGLILRPVEDQADADHVREIRSSGVPTVVFDREFDRIPMDFVGTDDYRGGRDAARYLLGLGHRVIGHIAGPEFARTGRLRRRGFEEAIAKRRSATCRVEVDRTFSDGAAQFAALMKGAKRPTAVFAANDLQALAALRQAHAMGLRVPEDVSILGFGDLAPGRACSPALSTFDQQARQIGRAAAEVLIRRIDRRARGKKPTARVHTEIPAVLVERKSTGPVPTRRPGEEE